MAPSRGGLGRYLVFINSLFEVGECENGRKHTDRRETHVLPAP